MLKCFIWDSPVKPSGPGDLDFGRLLIACSISGIVNGAFRDVSCCGDIEGRLVCSRKAKISSWDG